MMWVARAQIHGRGGDRQTLRLDGTHALSGRDFFYGLKRETFAPAYAPEPPVYYLVTWLNGRWASHFRRVQGTKPL